MSLSIKNNKTILFHLKKPYPPFVMLLAMPGFGVIKKGSENQTTPIGSGIMIPHFNKKEGFWKLTRNPHFQNEKTTFEEINLYYVPTKERLLDLLRQHRIDLALGFAYPDLTREHIPQAFDFAKLENHGTLHLYLNGSKAIFKSDALRKDLLRLIQASVKKSGFPGMFVEHHHRFIPPGIMPYTYYKETNFHSIEIEEFKRKWNKTVKNLHFDLYWREEYLNPAVGKQLESDLCRAGFSARVISKKYSEMIPILNAQTYDMVLMGYFGVISDPDGFLDPLKKDASILHYGVIPSDDLLTQLETVRFTRKNEERLNQYSQILKVFEEKGYFIPLFRLYLPAIVNEKLILPDTKYRFDLSLLDIKYEGN